MNKVAGAEVVAGMAACHAQRAAGYERVCFKLERQTDLRRMEAELAAPFADRRLLEIACGTSWWTPHSARDAASWLATDLNLETMAIAQAKALPACVRFATVDAFTLKGSLGDAVFNACYADCCWRHVPMQRLPSWLGALPARLAPGARVVFIDNSHVQTSSTPGSDSSTHEVLKNFPTAETAFAMLDPRARHAQWQTQVQTQWQAQWQAQRQAQWQSHTHDWRLSHEQA